MAVFTQITTEQLSDWLTPLNLGRLVEFKGIASGIENSNFFVTLDKDGQRTDYVLTIFEVLTAQQLPFYLELMQHLASKDLPVPRPFASTDGALFRPLAGKPAALVSKLAGADTATPTPTHCASVGRVLAQMHLAGRDFKGSQPNLRGLDWCLMMESQVAAFLPDHIADLLRDELMVQQDFAQTEIYQALPRGAGHCDLFVDNVLFENPDAPALIDFYFAGVDTWLFDLAVTANDWCIDRATGAFLPEHLNQMLAAYHAVNPLSDNEQAAWPILLRAAALRFWISRLFDFYQTREAAMLTPKDPTHFERILQNRRALCTQNATPWL